MYEHLTGRRLGKSQLGEMLVDRALRDGKTVLVVRPGGMYYVRQHSSGLRVITPVKDHGN